jgi:hypothetical protein
MKRREFIEKTGCGVLAVVLSQLGLKAFPHEGHYEEQKKKIKQMLIKNMGKSEAEAVAMLKEMEEKLSMVKTMCVCKTCPTYVKEEKEVAFCHPFISKSHVIKDEKGCFCPQCPVYKKMKMKNGYYCTRKSEMEQEMAKKM